MDCCRDPALLFSSLFGFINYRVLHHVLHLPTHIGLMTVALVAGSLVLLIDLICRGLNL
jgi:hypothetical protein